MFLYLKKKISGMGVVSRVAKPIYGATIGRIIYLRKQKVLSKNYLETLTSFDRAIKELNKSYWLEFGTLLGAVREGSAIKHDTDIDMGMYLDEYNSSIPEVLSRYGFKKIHELRSRTVSDAFEETYEYKGIHVDIFYFIKDNDSIYCYDFMRKDPFSRELTISKFGGLVVRRIPLTFIGLGEVNLSGHVFNIPEPIEQHLISHYGEDYLKPNPGWTSAKNAASAVMIDYSGTITFYTDK